MDDEEVTREVELFDDGQLMIDLGPCSSHSFGVTRPIARLGTAFGEQTQIRHLVEPIGTVIGRKIRSHQGEIECTDPTQLGSPLDHPGIAGEPTGLFSTRAQMGAGRGR